MPPSAQQAELRISTLSTGCNFSTSKLPVQEFAMAAEPHDCSDGNNCRPNCPCQRSIPLHGPEAQRIANRIWLHAGGRLMLCKNLRRIRAHQSDECEQRHPLCRVHELCNAPP